MKKFTERFGWATTRMLLTGAALAGLHATASPRPLAAQTLMPANRSETPSDIHWHTDLDSAINQAQAENKLVLLHFGASWCRPCRSLDTFVFSSTDVVSAVSSNMVAVKIDVDQQPDIVTEYGVTNVPFDVIITPGGKVINKRKSPSDARNYARMISQLESAAQKFVGTKAGLAQNTDLETIGRTIADAKPTSKASIQANPWVAPPTTLAEQAAAHQITTPGYQPVESKPFVNSEAQSRQQFLQRQRDETVPVRRPKPQRIVNETFFEQATKFEAPTEPSKVLPKPEVSAMIVPGEPESKCCRNAKTERRRG